PPTPSSTLFPYTTLFRSIEPLSERRDAFTPDVEGVERSPVQQSAEDVHHRCAEAQRIQQRQAIRFAKAQRLRVGVGEKQDVPVRSEEHTSELQSRGHLVC